MLVELSILQDLVIILGFGYLAGTLALIIILLKAGLGMDKQQLQRYGSVVIRLGYSA